MVDAADLAKRKYRLDIFLSVDVAGSTAFKFSNTLATAPEDKADTPQGWFGTIQKFYETFHQTFLNEIDEANSPKPELWKALGDELIYRTTIEDRREAAHLTKGFIEAIHRTRKVVRSRSKNLDLKGSAWIADFPARNAVIGLDGLHDLYQQARVGEIQTDQDVDSHRIQDFIGPSMDAGFRLGKAATRGKMALSVELALILAVATAERRVCSFGFGYDGREHFKGVLGGEGYPLIWIDIEDEPEQRQTNRREAAMLQRQPEVSAEVVTDFCESYIASSYWMEMPFLKNDNSGHFSDIPRSHIDHAEREITITLREEPLYSQDDPIGAVDENEDITAAQLLDQMPEPVIRDGDSVPSSAG